MLFLYRMPNDLTRNQDNKLKLIMFIIRTSAQAWLEEIHLRINGMVPFGEPMQKAHFLSRLIYGRIYQQSVPTSPSKGGWLAWLWWPVLWSGSHAIGTQRLTTRDGVDGEGENTLYGNNVKRGGAISRILPSWLSSSKTKLNRASNKP